MTMCSNARHRRWRTFPGQSPMLFLDSSLMDFSSHSGPAQRPSLSGPPQLFPFDLRQFEIFRNRTIMEMESFVPRKIFSGNIVELRREEMRVTVFADISQLSRTVSLKVEVEDYFEMRCYYYLQSSARTRFAGFLKPLPRFPQVMNVAC